MDFLFFLNFISCIICVPSLKVSTAVETLGHSQFLRDDGTTLVSQGRTFELGFFSPRNSKNRYLGIWYKNIPIQTVVWVANGLNPINDSSGTLTMNTTGCLVLSSHNDTVIWYSTITNSPKQAHIATATLLDSGNLVVCEEKNSNPDEDCLWQSFDYASDTLLPGMRNGWSIRKGLNWTLTAWKSPNDPAPGDFTSFTTHSEYPEAYLMKGAEKYSRFGPFNGLISSGSPQVNNYSVYTIQYVKNKDEFYYTYYLANTSVISRIVMNQTDYTRYRYVWVDTDQTWKVYASKPVDYCDRYGLCGSYGNCIIDENPICQCLKGFRPKSPEAWNSMGDWSQGCVRDKPLSCMEKLTDGFVRLEDLKVPDTTYTWVDETIGLEECKAKCLNNCSCMAFTNSNISGKGSGCVMWFGDLLDIRQFQSQGQFLYIRMPASELEDGESGHRKNSTTIVASTIAGFAGILLIGCYIIYKFRRSISVKLRNIQVQINGRPDDDLGLPLLSISTLASATSNFSKENKIGEGGFGPVYKGRLIDGRDIAVKRLSCNSGQGINEFKTEVKLIAKLQHRNLVRLVGCCIQENEQMLVYEYMSNGSLDSFIFDHNKGKLLDWPKRFHIISGIARGLTYLHQDSRLRIIHRDLKTSNILLDEKLNPKISDFGTARTFGEEQIEGSTNRVVGTYGYMAPEYIAKGLFSVKSDVFSFGIMVLEIIYGKKSRGFYHSDHHHNLIGHAWILWKEGRASELSDENIRSSLILSEVLRCIHVSLLCVQRHPDDRPNMSSVVLMLGSEMEIPEPKQPGFFLQQANSSTNQMQSESSNEMSMTLLEAR